ncbi:MAG: sulfurtransferase [Candidatus Omnitrophica bacterium]|nr:sulfurtransferase [Candidatus Omnitrophota bacterium]
MIKNIAFYHFFKPTYNLEETKNIIKARMVKLGIRGTILLASEGINGSFAGPIAAMDNFMDFLLKTIGGSHPILKITYSQNIPFTRTLVKVKPAIVAEPGTTPIDLSKDSAPYITPTELHRWIQEGKKVVILDTRNEYEYQVGKFKNSVHLGTKHFAEFEADLDKAPAEWKDTPIVTFCTGGIRCEKAAPLMLKKGFREVYQLDGGILNYFKEIGLGYFEGHCFVFDQRVLLDENLNPTSLAFLQELAQSGLLDETIIMKHDTNTCL